MKSTKSSSCSGAHWMYALFLPFLLAACDSTDAGDDLSSAEARQVFALISGLAIGAIGHIETTGPGEYPCDSGTLEVRGSSLDITLIPRNCNVSPFPFTITGDPSIQYVAFGSIAGQVRWDHSDGRSGTCVIEIDEEGRGEACGVGIPS